MMFTLHEACILSLAVALEKNSCIILTKKEMGRSLLLGLGRVAQHFHKTNLYRANTA